MTIEKKRFFPVFLLMFLTASVVPAQMPQTAPAGMPLSAVQTGAPSACYLTGLSLMGRQDYQAASDRFSQCTTQDPGDWRAWAGLGDARARLGDPAFALKAYEQSLSLQPDNPAVEKAMEGLKTGTTPAGTAPISQGDFRDCPWWAKIGASYGPAQQGDFKDIVDTFRAYWGASDLPVDAEVGSGLLGFQAELGHTFHKHFGVSASLDLLLPGNLSATVKNDAGWWLTQKLSQTLIPISLNAVGFVPLGKGRLYSEAGAGPVLAFLTHDVDIQRTLVSENRTFGLGLCARWALGCQWPLDGHSTLDVALRTRWMGVPKYKGTYQDSEGDHQGELLVDETGFVYAAREGEDIPPGGRRLSSDILDLGLRVALAYHFF